MAAAIPILSAAGAVFSAIGAISGGQSARRASDYNAAIADRNAVVATQQASANEEAQRKIDARRMGAARAGYGASGVTSDGSVLDVLGDSIAEAELNALNIRYEGKLAAQGYGDTAASARASGKSAQRAGYMQAGAALLTGGSKAYDIYQRGNPSKPAGNKISIYDDAGF